VRRRQGGFSLVEIAIAIAVLGVFVAVAANVAAVSVARANTRATETTLTRIEQSIVTYAFANLRLPCADTTGDGFGDCTGRDGWVPYADLGLGGLPQDGWGRPIRYVHNQHFAPPVLGSNSVYGFCQEMFSFARVAAATGLQSDQGTNLAFVLVSGGERDLSGDKDPVDVLVAPATGNAYRLSAVDYGDDATDDFARSRSFLSLAGQFECTGQVAAVNTLENEVINMNLLRGTLGNNISRYEGLIDGANFEILQGALAIASSAIQIAGAAATMIDAIGQGLMGNGAAIAAAAGAVTAAAAGIAGIVQASIQIAGARADIADNTDKINDTRSYGASALNVCNSANATITAAKGRSIACESSAL